MGGKSLQDQLHSLGLARAKKGKPARSTGKPERRGKAGSGNAEMSLDQAYRLRKQNEARSTREKKEQKRLEDLERRRINKEIQALVDAHGLNDKGAEIKRNFLYKGRIRSVLVTPEQLRALNAGELGVVFLRGNYTLMLPGHVDLVRSISEDHVPDLGGSEADNEEGEFKVPDDLIW